MTIKKKWDFYRDVLIIVFIPEINDFFSDKMIDIA